MNRAEFMRRLEELLQDIPAEEREEAVQYYQDYFDDAGPECESEIIRELESPEKVAAMIKADINGFLGDNGEYTEAGYRDSFDSRSTPVRREYRYQSAHNRRNSAKAGREGTSASRGYRYDYASGRPRSRSLAKILLILLIIIVAFPVVLPVSFSGLAVVIALICAVLGLFIGLAVGALAMVVGGFAVVIAGIIKFVSAFPIGIFTAGVGLILLALGLAATVAAVKICLVVYPAIFRAVVNIFRIPLHRKGGPES